MPGSQNEVRAFAFGDRIFTVSQPHKSCETVMATGLAAGVYAALGTFTVSQPNFFAAVLGIL